MYAETTKTLGRVLGVFGNYNSFDTLNGMPIPTELDGRVI